MNLPNLITTAHAQAVTPLVNVQNVDTSNIDTYSGSIFQIVIQIGILIAVLSIAWWGLRTILSKVPGFKGEGKERMIDALLGLGLLLAAWVILNTINPDLLTKGVSQAINGLGAGN